MLRATCLSSCFWELSGPPQSTQLLVTRWPCDPKHKLQVQRPLKPQFAESWVALASSSRPSSDTSMLYSGVSRPRFSRLVELQRAPPSQHTRFIASSVACRSTDPKSPAPGDEVRAVDSRCAIVSLHRCSPRAPRLACVSTPRPNYTLLFAGGSGARRGLHGESSGPHPGRLLPSGVLGPFLQAPRTQRPAAEPPAFTAIENVINSRFLTCLPRPTHALRTAPSLPHAPTAPTAHPLRTRRFPALTWTRSAPTPSWARP